MKLSRPPALAGSMLLLTLFAILPARAQDTCTSPQTINPGVLPFGSGGDTTWVADDYTAPGASSGGRDLVFALTPISSAVFHIEVSTTWDALVYVVTDCGNVAGTLVGVSQRMGPSSSAYVEHLDLPLAAATTYSIILDGATAADYGNFSIYVDDGPFERCGFPPSQHLIPTLLPEFVDVSTTIGAISDHDLGLTCGLLTSANGPDVAYRFTPPATGAYSLELSNDVAPAFLFVSQDGGMSCTSGGAFLVSGINPPAAPWVSPPVVLTGGMQYCLLVDTSAAFPNLNFTLRLAFANPDGTGGDCGTPTDVAAGPNPETFLRDTARPPYSDSIQASACTFSQPTVGAGPNALFRITPQTSRARFRLTSSHDGVLYASPVCTAGVPPVEVASCLGTANQTTIGGTEVLSLTGLIPGTPFDLVVDGSAAADGGDVVLVYEKLPDNDTCATARAIPAVPSYVEAAAFTSFGADDYQATCPPFFQPTSGPDVVWTLTPAAPTSPRTFHIRVEPDGASGFNPAVYVTTSCTPPFTSCVAASDSGGDENLSVTLSNGTTYYVFVDSSMFPPGDSGAFEFGVDSWQDGDSCERPITVNFPPAAGSFSTAGMWNDYPAAGLTPLPGPDAVIRVQAGGGQLALIVDATFDVALVRGDGAVPGCPATWSSAAVVDGSTGCGQRERLVFTPGFGETAGIPFLIDSATGASGSVSYRIGQVPDNDTLATADTLSLPPDPQEPFLFADDLTFAGNDAGGSISCGGSGFSFPGPDLFYRFTPSHSGTARYRFDVTPAAFDVALYLLDATGTTCLAAVDAAGTNGRESLQASLDMGVTYYLVVDSAVCSAMGTFSGSLDLVPSNDRCATAEPITIDLGDPVFTRRVRIDPANNDLSGTTSDCPAAGDDDVAAPGPDVVWSWEVDASLVGKTFYVSLSTQYDGILYASTGCPTGTPPAAPVTGCVDVASTGAGRIELLTFTPSAAGLVYFVADSVAGVSGYLDFRVEPAYAPGDNCGNPIVVRTGALDLPFEDSDPIDTADYWNEFRTKVDCAAFMPDTGEGPDVVHRIVVSRSGRYRIRATPQGAFDPILYVYPNAGSICHQSTGASPDPACIAFADSAGAGGTEELVVDFVAGRSYDVVVDGETASDTGLFRLFVAAEGDLEISAFGTDTGEPTDPNRNVVYPGSNTFLGIGLTNRDSSGPRTVQQIRIVSLTSGVNAVVDTVTLAPPLVLGVGTAGAPDPDSPDFPLNVLPGVLRFTVDQDVGCGARADFLVEITCAEAGRNTVDFVSVPLGNIAASSFVRAPATIAPSLGLGTSAVAWAEDGTVFSCWTDAAGIKAFLTDTFGNRAMASPSLVHDGPTRSLSARTLSNPPFNEYAFASTGMPTGFEYVAVGRFSSSGTSMGYTTLGQNRIASNPFGFENAGWRTIDLAYGKRFNFGFPTPTLLVAWAGEYETSIPAGYPLKVAYCADTGCGSPLYREITRSQLAVTNVAVDWDGVGWVLAWDESRPGAGYDVVRRSVTFLDPNGNELTGARVEIATDEMTPPDPRQRTSMIWDGTTYAFAWSEGPRVFFARLASSGSFDIAPGVPPVAVATLPGTARPRFVDLSWVPAREHYRLTWTTADAFGKVQTITVRPDGTVDPTEVITDVSGSEYGHRTIRPMTLSGRELLAWNGGTSGSDQKLRLSFVDPFTEHALVNASPGTERNVTQTFSASAAPALDAVRDAGWIGLAFADDDNRLHFWRLSEHGSHVDCGSLDSGVLGTMTDSNILVAAAVDRAGNDCATNLLAVGAGAPDGNGNGSPTAWRWGSAEALAPHPLDAGSRVQSESANRIGTVGLADSPSVSRHTLAYVRRGGGGADDLHLSVQQIDASGDPFGSRVDVSTNAPSGEPVSSPSIAFGESATLGYSGRFAIAWIDRRAAWSDPSIGFAFFDPATGAVSGEHQLLPLGSGTTNPEVRIAWNGIEYGVLYRDTPAGGGSTAQYLKFARVARDGTLVPSSTTLVDTGSARDLDLVFTGTVWAAAWADEGAFERHIRMTELSRFGEALGTPWQVPVSAGQDGAPKLLWFGDSYRLLYASNVGYRDVFMTRVEKPAAGIVCATVNTRPYPDLVPGGVTAGCNADGELLVDLAVPRSGTSVLLDGSGSSNGSIYHDCSATEDALWTDPGGSIVRYEWKLNSDTEPTLFDSDLPTPTFAVGWATLSDHGMTEPGIYKVWLRVTDNTVGRSDLTPAGPASASSQIRSIDLRLVDVTPPVVTVATPNGGETIVAGSTATISWSATDDVDVDHVSIYLCSDYGASSCSGTWTLLHTTAPGETFWNWGVPSGQVLSATNRIKVVAYDTATPACTFPTSCDDLGEDESNANFYVVAANPEAVRTVILWSSAQFEAIHGASARAATSAKLAELAGNQRVVGTVFDLSTDTAIAAKYAAWNAAGRTDNTLGNDLADAIRTKLHTPGTGLLSSIYTGTKWIVLVGDDRIVPFFRVADQTGIMFEQKYSQPPQSEIDCTTSEGSAICANRFLSDAAYADVVADSSGGTSFNLPDYGIGRLVETPAEIATTINTFIARDGQGPLGRAAVAGWDFLDDAAVSIRNRYQARPTIATTALLQSVDGNFGAAALQSMLVGSPAPDSAAFLGHAAHYALGCPVGALLTDGIDADPDLLTGGVPYSAGCHSGLNVTTTNGSFHPLDLPQEMMRKRAVAYVAPTGFGWGLSTGIGLTERLVDLYTQQLLAGGTVEIGTAWLEAKRRYFLEQTELDVFDKKVLEEWTIYGLPMYRLAGPAGEADTPAAPSAGDGVDHVDWNGITIDKSIDGGKGVRTNGTLPDGLTQLSLSFAFSSSSYSKIATAGVGDYWRLNGENTAEVGVSLQPKFTYDSRLSGVKLHGTLWLGGVYRPATLLVDDGFESGAIGGGWSNVSATPWSVSTTSPYRGLDSARSGAIPHGTSTDLLRSVTLSAGGRVTFARRVSSEPGNDFLEFAIDGVAKDAWSGEVSWGEVSFPVAAGTHSLRWRYSKNGSISMGTDAAFVDVVRVDDDPDVTPVTGVPQNSSTGPQAQPTPFLRGATPTPIGTEGDPTGCLPSPTRFDSLTVTTGFLEPVGGSQKQRVFDDYDVASFYSTNCDVTPPTIVGAGPYHTVSGTTASFSVQATDSGSGVYRVVVVYDDVLSVPRAWKPIDLSFGGATSRWTGTLPFRAPTRYIVEAVDSAGNVAVASISQPDLQQGTGESWGTTTTAARDFALTFADADADGLSDSWEAQYGVTDPAADGDQDGLTNLEEFRASTDPTNPDSDGGGDNDGSEVHHGRDAGGSPDDREISLQVTGSGAVDLDWTSAQNSSIDGPFWVYRWQDTPFYTSGTLLTPSPLGNGVRTFPDAPGAGNFFYLVRNAPFQYPAPSIAFVTPPSGPAGTNVTIYGDDFRPGVRVTFGGVLAVDIVRVNSSKITCKAPTHAAGAVDVSIENTDHQGATATAAYTYP